MPDLSPAQMAALHGACFTTPRPWSTDEITALLQSPNAFALSESGGFLMGRVIVDEAELLTVAVSPDLRRSGIGARLIAGFVGLARSRGAGNAFLEVAADNTAALALYFRAGFAQTGRRRAYYSMPDGTRTDALLLSRGL